MKTNHTYPKKSSLRAAAASGGLGAWLALSGLALVGAMQCAAQTFTSFDPSGSTCTGPVSINPRQAITGYCLSSGVYHGFLRAPDGAITAFDVPDSTFTFPIPAGINPREAITGHYLSSGVYHGFLRAPDGTITTFEQALNELKQAAGPVAVRP
jgi:hypothetical protein